MMLSNVEIIIIENQLIIINGWNEELRVLTNTDCIRVIEVLSTTKNTSRFPKILTKHAIRNILQTTLGVNQKKTQKVCC